MTKITNWGSEDPAEVAKGGTGVATNTAYAVLCGGTTATGAIQSIASVGTADQVLTSNGAGALPTFQDAGGGGGSIEFITSTTISDDATIDFTDLSSTYAVYIFELLNIHCATDDKYLMVRTSTDNGSNYDSSGYYYATVYNNGTSFGAAISYSGAGMLLTGSNSSAKLGSASNENYCGTVKLYYPSDSSTYTMISGYGGYRDNSGSIMTTSFSGFRASAADVDAIRFLMESGNLSSGTIKVYGVKAS